MSIFTEPIGSIPRPASLIEAILGSQVGKTSEATLEGACAEALRDTIRRFEQTGSPVISDGEQTKPSFATYPLSGLTNLAPDGVVIPFADGHTRQLPRLTAGPFRYGVHAASYVESARRYTQLPIKQAVISASALSLLYPSEAIPGYSRDEFLADLINEAKTDIRGALDAGAASVQIDFTEARLSLKLDPSGGLLRSFVALNNHVLDRFTAEDRQRIGVHVCPGGDHDSTHSEKDSTLPTRSTFAGQIRLISPGEAFPSAPTRRVRRFKPISFLRPAWPADSSGRAIHAPSSSQRALTFSGRLA